MKAIAVDGNNVYVGGAFTTAGGITVNHIARWDGNTWHAMGSGTSGTVNAIAVQGQNVYIGGQFIYASNQVVNLIARWDGSTWQPLGSGLGSYSSIQTIKAASEGIYAAGLFHPVTGQYTAFNIALWNGSSWSNLGSGIQNGWVNDVLPLDNRMFTGGQFTQAGNNWSDGFAIWNRQAEAVVLDIGEAPVAPGSTIYLYGKFFVPYQTVELAINGKILTSNLTADGDGKVYIRLLTKPENEDGVYTFTLTSATQNTSGSFTLEQGAEPYSAPYTGWNFTYPPYTVDLPAIRR
jgi:hypothetical protein